MKLTVIARGIKVLPVDRFEDLSCEDLLRVELSLHEDRCLLKEVVRELQLDYPEVFSEIAKEDADEDRE